jgi:hypothetical protein
MLIVDMAQYTIYTVMSTEQCPYATSHKLRHIIVEHELVHKLLSIQPICFFATSQREYQLTRHQLVPSGLTNTQNFLHAACRPAGLQTQTPTYSGWFSGKC